MPKKVAKEKGVDDFTMSWTTNESPLAKKKNCLSRLRNEQEALSKEWQ